MKKRIFALILIVVMLFCSVTSDYHEAQAAVVGTVVTVGALLLMAAGITCVYANAKNNVTDWTGFGNYIGDYINRTSKTVTLVNTFWTAMLASKIKGGTKTLQQALNNNEKVNYFDYAIDNTNSFTMTMNKPIRTIFNDGINAYYGYKSLTPSTIVQTRSGRMIELNKIFTQYKIPYDYSYEFNNTTTYKSIIAIKNGNYLDVVQMSDKPWFIIDYKVVNGVYQAGVWLMNLSDYKTWSFKDGKYQGVTTNTATIANDITYYNVSSDQYDGKCFNIVNEKSNDYGLIYLGAIDDCLLGKEHNLAVIDNLANVIYENVQAGSMYVIDKLYNTQTLQSIREFNYVIDNSSYDIDKTKDVVIDAKGEIGAAVETNIDIGVASDTDKIAKAIKDADDTAEKAGTDVVDNDITDTTNTDNPAGTKTLVDWTGLGDIIKNALKEAFEWLFVPDQAKVQEFVAQATAKVNSNANILLYPIELVIRFMNELSNKSRSDCILTIPQIKYKGFILYAGTTFNFTDFIEQSDYKTAYDVYIYVTDFILIIAVLNLALKKGDEIIRGN